MSDFLATFSDNTSITLNGGGTINFNSAHILKFTGSTLPDSPAITDEGKIYFDIRTSDQLAVYNKWVFEKNIMGLNFIFYIPSGLSGIPTAITNGFKYKVNGEVNENDVEETLYCPYGNIGLDIPATVTSITMKWTTITGITLPVSNNIATLNLDHSRNITNIDNINTNSLANLSLSGCVGLKNWIMKNDTIVAYEKLSALNVGNIGLVELPNLSNLKNLESLNIYYNNLSGTLNLNSLPSSIKSLTANGNSYTKLIIPEYDNIEDYRTISVTENLIESADCDCSYISFLALSVNPLKSLHISNIGKIEIVSTEGTENKTINKSILLPCCQLNSIYIDGIYMDKCSVIRDYVTSKEVGYFKIANNYLNMDKQGLNTNDIYVSPQFISNNRLSYDPASKHISGNPVTFNGATCVMPENADDQKLVALDWSEYINIDFNNISTYCEGYIDEYIKQRILLYKYNNSDLNLYNIGNLIKDPNSTMSKALTLAGKHYTSLKYIRTNNPELARFFPNTRIILTDPPLQDPSIFSISLVVEK